MQGPSDNYRPKTAGERSGSSGSGDGVRDWQRNTWFGPAPLNNNPFDEPEDAPELKEIRSENVTQHVGEFWQSPGKGYQDTTSSAKITGAEGRNKSEKKKAHPRAFRVFIGAIILIAGIVLILRFAVFSVKQILSLNEKTVEERITSDYRLQFRYMVRELPSTVTLSVKESEPCCWLTYCGIMYVMDKNRMVLYESENPAEQPQDLVEIKGLEVRSNTLVGQYINLGNDMQQSIFTELFLEMKVLGCIDQIKEADISNTSSILLATRGGYTAALGDRTNIHAKLRSLLLVQEELKRLGNFGGTINVTNPEIPIYTP